MALTHTYSCHSVQRIMLSPPRTTLPSEELPSSEAGQSSSISSTSPQEQFPTPPPQSHEEILTSVNNALYKISDGQDKLFNEEIRRTWLVDEQRAEAIMKTRSASMNTSLPIYLSVTEVSGSQHMAPRTYSGRKRASKVSRSRPKRKRILKILLNKDESTGQVWMLDMALGKRTFVSKKGAILVNGEQSTPRCPPGSPYTPVCTFNKALPTKGPDRPRLRGGFLESGVGDGGEEDDFEDEDVRGNNLRRQAVDHHHPRSATPAATPTGFASREQNICTSTQLQPRMHLATDKDVLSGDTLLYPEISQPSINDGDLVDSRIRFPCSVDRIIQRKQFVPNISGFGLGISYLVRWAPTWVSEEEYWSGWQTAIGDIRGRRDAPDGWEILVAWPDSWVYFEGRDTCSTDEIPDTTPGGSDQFSEDYAEKVETWLDEMSNPLGNKKIATETPGPTALDSLSVRTKTTTTFRDKGLVMGRKVRQSTTNNSSNPELSYGYPFNTSDEKLALSAA